MKRLLLVLIGVSTSFIGFSQSTYQYFDGADTIPYNTIYIQNDTSSSNIWQIGAPQKSIFDSAATFPNVIVTDTVNYYPINNESSFIIGTSTQLWGPGIFAIQWKQKLDMDNGTDGGTIEYSSDTGTTWQSVFNSPYTYNFFGFNTINQVTLPNGDFAFSGTDSTWKDIWLCFDASWLGWGGDSIMFKYTLKSDSIENNKEGWMIDNMQFHITIIHTIDEIEQSEYLKVSPNITSNRINIKAKKMDVFHIIEKMELINSEGKIVEEFGTSPTKFYIDIGDHANGIYFLKIKTNMKTETFKIILQHD